MTAGRLPVVFVSRARREISEAAEWWHENRPAAPGAITRDLRYALALLREAPEIGAPMRGARLPNVRRLLLEKVNYHLYYRLRKRAHRLEILAFWHARRQPPAL